MAPPGVDDLAPPGEEKAPIPAPQMTPSKGIHKDLMWGIGNTMSVTVCKFNGLEILFCTYNLKFF